MKRQRGFIWYAVIPFILVTGSPVVGWQLGEALDDIDEDDFDQIYNQVFTREEQTRLDDICPWYHRPLDGEIKRELVEKPGSECSQQIKGLIHKHFAESQQ